LVEGHDIGWSWWPLKKIGTNNPLEVPMTPQYQRLVDYFTGKEPRPSAAEAEEGLHSLLRSIREENNIYHKEVIASLFGR
jgi:hypothetical protein